MNGLNRNKIFNEIITNLLQCCQVNIYMRSFYSGMIIHVALRHKSKTKTNKKPLIVFFILLFRLRYVLLLRCDISRSDCEQVYMDHTPSVCPKLSSSSACTCTGGQGGLSLVMVGKIHQIRFSVEQKTAGSKVTADSPSFLLHTSISVSYTHLTLPTS